MKQIHLLAIVCLLLCSCHKKPNALYLDLNNNAMVSCTDTIKEIDIETPQSTIVIKGPVYHKPFYLNKQNLDYSITIDGEQQTGYIIPLQPKTSYIVRTENGSDEGPGAVTFATDEKGNIISASKTQCN